MGAQIEHFYTEVGRRVRAYRTKLGLTQEELGKFLSPPTTRVSIANVESGKQRVLSHTLVQLAAALNVQPAELFSQETKDASPSSGNEGDIATELVTKAGLSKSTAKKLIENPRALKPWKDEKA